MPRRCTSLFCFPLLVLLAFAASSCSRTELPDVSNGAQPSIELEPASAAADSSIRSAPADQAALLELVSQTGEAFPLDGPTLEARAEELWQITSWSADPANPDSRTGVDATGARYSYTVDPTGDNNVQSVTATFDVEVSGDTAYFVARPALTAASLTAADDETGIEWALNAIDVLSAGLVGLGDGAVRFAPNSSLAATAVLDRDQATITVALQPARRLDSQPAESATGTLALAPAPSEPIVSTSTRPVSTIAQPDSLPPRDTTLTTSAVPTTASSTTTSTAPPTSTTTTRPPTTEQQVTVATAVKGGAFCSPTGATGKSSTGKDMICSRTMKDGTPYDEGKSRWRQP